MKSNTPRTGFTARRIAKVALFTLGLASALAPSFIPWQRACAQSVAYTDPVGVTNTSLLANSDSEVSIPFTRPSVYVGQVGSISGSTITLAGTSPGWTASQYVYAAGAQSNTYYAIIGSNLTALTGTIGVTNGTTAVTGSGTSFTTQTAVGDELQVNGLAYNVSAIASDAALTLSRAYTGATAAGLSAQNDHSPGEGSYFTITGNGTNTLTVNLNGDSLSAVAAGTSLSIIPYWTIGGVFPSTAAGVSFTASTSPTSRGTQILLPDLTDPNINLAPTSIYYFLNGAWQLDGGSSTTAVYNDTILPPSTYFTVRNVSTPTTLTVQGGVYMNRLTIPLDSQANAPQDNAVALMRPAAVTLNDLGLIASGAFVPSASTVNRADLLFFYSNTTPGINKAASAIYYYYNGAWRLDGAPDATVDYGSTPVPYGGGLTIRKAASGSGMTGFWQNTRTY
jgi:uncharacterized protein (TIGR02597 family)